MAVDNITSTKFPTIKQLVAISIISIITTILYVNLGSGIYVPQAQQFDVVSPQPIHHQFNSSGNTIKNHIVYVKVEKTGSSTMAAMILSYGYRNKLNLMMSTLGKRGCLVNTEDMDYGLSWDTCPNRKDPHILVNHARYKPEFYKKYFTTKPVFVTTLREPTSWFISLVNYMKPYINHTPSEVLDNDELFYKTRQYITGMKTWVHNNFLQWLGFDIDKSEDIETIQKHIETLDADFDLVMLREYFDESLILLKRMMGWSMADIFYGVANVAHKQSKTEFTERQKLKLIDKKHNLGDWLLYHHFNRTFWKKVSQQQRLYEEVHSFRRLNSKVQKFCNSKNLKRNKTLVLKLSSEWEPAPMYITDENCLTIRIDDNGFPMELYNKLDEYCKFRHSLPIKEYWQRKKESFTNSTEEQFLMWDEN